MPLLHSPLVETHIYNFILYSWFTYSICCGELTENKHDLKYIYNNTFIKKMPALYVFKRTPALSATKYIN